MALKFTTPWGIKCFDNLTAGLPALVTNVVETRDHQIGLLTLGHFLMNGLEAGENCTLLTFENPLSFLESFEGWGFDFLPYLKNEQFYYLNYRSNVSQEVGLTQNYQNIFEEIHRLSTNGVHRIAIHQMDTLLNLQSQTLINSCVLKLVNATMNSPSTILAQFVNFDDKTHNNIRVSCLKYAPGYFSFTPEPNDPEHVRLNIEKIPSFDYVNQSILLGLEKNSGFVQAKAKNAKVA